jgi:hypothetical protein
MSADGDVERSQAGSAGSSRHPCPSNKSTNASGSASLDNVVSSTTAQSASHARLLRHYGARRRESDGTKAGNRPRRQDRGGRIAWMSEGCIYLVFPCYTPALFCPRFSSAPLLYPPLALPDSGFLTTKYMAVATTHTHYLVFLAFFSACLLVFTSYPLFSLLLLFSLVVCLE